MNSLFLLILGHIVADFLFQTHRICAEKSAFRCRGFVKHLLIVFLTYVVLFLPYFSLELLLALLLFSLLHILVDLIKNLFTAEERTDLPLFLLDQGVHLVLIYIFWGVTEFTGNKWVQTAASGLLFPKAVAVWELFCQGLSAEKALLTLIVYTSVVYGGAIFIKKVLDLPLFSLRNREDQPALTGDEVAEIKKVGCYLGMLERALIITFTALNSIGAVAFVFTAKSIARFNELNQKDFAEYYLTGTLLSVLLGIMGGVGLRYLLSCLA
ncbi:MAG TPA: DUF3307 domain-containing protein [Firmicutes bacterium]|nr:DUF3307 domain-containing protein [Bacillota bacterium]